MRRLLTLAAVTCAVSTQVVLAYLSPTEVFPGLDVPAQEFSSAYSESSSEISTIEASSSSTHSAAPIFYKGGERVPQHPNPTSQPAKEEPEENIFMEEQTPEPTPEPEPTVSPEEELTDEELAYARAGSCRRGGCTRRRGRTKAFCAYKTTKRLQYNRIEHEVWHWPYRPRVCRLLLLDVW